MPRTSLNTRVLLTARPEGIPDQSAFTIVDAPIPALGDGDILVRTIFLSVDPGMRGWVNAADNYREPVALGDVMPAFAVGEVLASRDPGVVEGDKVVGMFGWQTHAVIRAPGILRKLSASALPLSAALGVTGINGLTAYFGLFEIAGCQPGERVVVSTAAGAVGSLVGQLAKIAGCHAVGIAGGPRKIELCLKKFRYDAAIDYKSGEDLGGRLRQATPDGVDIYFDNTSGRISDAVLSQIRVGARIVVCGTTAIPNWTPPPSGPRVERHLLVKRARMQGMLVTDFAAGFADAIARLEAWVLDGSLGYSEHILDGIDAAPGAIALLYRGENHGKLLIRTG
jgi:NADPH-dependent curcumin reductase CurA